MYQYFTESALWATWQGVDATVDPIPGGVFTVTMDNGLVAEGRFVYLEPNKRVVFTWGWVDHPGVPPGSSTVEVDLIADGPTTLVRLTHSGLPAEEIELHTLGWNHYVPRLVAAAEGTNPGLDPGVGKT